MGKKSGKPGGSRSTTQRVDDETLTIIKTINYHLLKSKNIRISQTQLIKYALLFAYGQEAEFIEFVETGKLPRQTTFDLLVEATSKPWFPYGNLVELK
ncbi:MAG: hypothetical protein GF414_05005 [Candidatus Altiarchaeales archaeon]|nr:hypothetical protein [Candidatus Altiarchaeales archaeon]